MGKWLHIGVIGGFGPRASAHFYRLLIDQCSERYHAILDSDYPYITLVSLASTGLSPEGLIDEAVLMSDLDGVIKFLGKSGAKVVAIPCNTIYAYLDNFPQCTPIRLINLPQEIVEATSRLQAKDVGIVCSRGLRNKRAFDPYFLAKGIRPHYPETSAQNAIDRWILEVMGGHCSTQTLTNLLGTVEALASQCDVVVLACSELSVLVGLSGLPANTIDSMRVLAEATLRDAYCSADSNLSA